MKTCKYCQQTKEEKDFTKGRNCCKICTNINKKQTYIRHREKTILKSKEYYRKNKDSISESRKKYREKNKEVLRQIRKDRYPEQKDELNKRKRLKRDDKVRQREKEYYVRNKERRNRKRREYFKNKFKTDIEYKLAHNMRSRLRQILKNTKNKISHVKELGCTVEFLKNYIESKFYENSNGIMMSWENWGLGVDKWQIDHILEFRDIDVNNHDELLKVTHYSNLQPLWHEDHIKKTFNRKE